MSDENYKYSYHTGPFYRKFMAGDNVWCEVNRDGRAVYCFTWETPLMGVLRLLPKSAILEVREVLQKMYDECKPRLT
jgi:hypothetical protein